MDGNQEWRVIQDLILKSQDSAMNGEIFFLLWKFKMFYNFS